MVPPNIVDEPGKLKLTKRLQKNKCCSCNPTPPPSVNQYCVTSILCLTILGQSSLLNFCSAHKQASLLPFDIKWQLIKNSIALFSLVSIFHNWQWIFCIIFMTILHVEDGWWDCHVCEVNCVGGGESSVQIGVGQSLSQVWVEGRSKAGRGWSGLTEGGQSAEVVGFIHLQHQQTYGQSV